MHVDIPADRPRVEFPLASGGTVILAPLSHEDRGYLARGLAELSEASRFARFGQGIETLSGQELDYLTNVDQRRHVVWAAVVADEGAGVGRYIVGEEGSADLAITVVDAHQGTGVGTALFCALAAVALADGVEQFHADVTPGNRRVIEWLAGAGVAVRQGADGLIQGMVPLAGLEIPMRDELVAAMDQFRGQSAFGSSSSDDELTQ